MATDSAAPTIYVGNQQPKQDEVVTSNGSTTPVATQREDALAQAADATQAQREAVEADKLSALEDQEKAAVAVDQADANAAQAQADEAKAAEERLAQEHARSEELRSHALGEYDAMSKKVANQRYEDFFAGKDGTSRKIKAGLSILAGGLGAGMQNAGAALLGQVGHFQNQAAEAVNKAIDRDFEKQKAQLAADRDALLQQGAHVNMVNAYTKEHELGIEAERTLAKERTLAEAKAEMVRAGLPAKEIERRIGILQEKLNVNAEKEKYLTDQRHLETPKYAQKTFQRQSMTYAPVPGNPNGDAPAPKNEQQGKAQGFGEAMANGLGQMADATPALTDKDTQVLNGTRSGWVNQLTSGQISEAFVKSERQKIQDAVTDGRASPAALKYFDGMNQYVNAKLRQESGAAISKEEAGQEIDRTMISKGEKPAEHAKRLATYAVPIVKNTLAQGYKQGSNEKLIGDLTGRLGAAPVAPSAQGQPSRPGPGAVIETGGKRYRVGPDGKSLTEVR